MPEWLDHVHRPSARDCAEAYRRSNKVCPQRPEMPLRFTGWDPSCCCSRCQGDGAVMMRTKENSTSLNRRNFLKGSGVLIVGFSTAGMLPIEVLARAAQGNPVRDYPKFPLDSVDSFVEIHGDGNVLIKIGKINNGQGTPTSWAMMAADELDVPLSKVEVRFGDT